MQTILIEKKCESQHGNNPTLSKLPETGTCMLPV